MAAKLWIKRAVGKPGAFKAQAEKTGKSTAGFAAEHDDDSGKTGKRARLAETLMKLRKT